MLAVVNRVVIAALDEKVPVLYFLNGLDVIIGHRCRILFDAVIIFEVMAVKAVQSAVCANPKESFRVFENGIYLVVR
jgi:hypothetical protein